MKKVINFIKAKIEIIKIQYEKIKSAVKNYTVKIYEKIKSLVISIIDDFKMIDMEEGQAKYSFHWWFMKSLKWITALILALITLFLWGCGSSMETMKYYPVNIPVKCEIESIKKPEYKSNIIETNLNILHYTSKLEAALKVCTDGVVK